MADNRAKVAGVDELLWPVRDVSTDPNNLTKLDEDGNVLTSTTDLDARYVNVTGDTMTGVLSVSPSVLPTYPKGSLDLSPSVQGTASIGIETFSDFDLAGSALALKRSRGNAKSIQPLVGGDFVGELSMWAYMPSGRYARASVNQVYVTETPDSGDSEPISRTVLHSGGGITIQSVGPQPSPRGVVHVGIGWTTPTHKLEVGGDAIIRGPLEVTGNITSAGTAHSFAAGSIPSPAVIGSTPTTIAATGSAGSAGQMVWDDNFIYLRTTSGWKKVALTAI
jgi:hypothetical protein